MSDVCVMSYNPVPFGKQQHNVILVLLVFTCIGLIPRLTHTQPLRMTEKLITGNSYSRLHALVHCHNRHECITKIKITHKVTFFSFDELAVG